MYYSSSVYCDEIANICSIYLLLFPDLATVFESEAKQDFGEWDTIKRTDMNISLISTCRSQLIFVRRYILINEFVKIEVNTYRPWYSKTIH